MMNHTEMSLIAWSRKGTLLLLVGLLLGLSACSGPRGRDRGPEEPAERLPEPVELADYEDFDPAPYRETPPERTVELEHDVPKELMEARADEGIVRTVQGYRIQIFSSQDKSAAVEIEEEAKSWWRAQREEESDLPSTLFPEELPVYIFYRQPYYRVRIGNFASRAAAERARSFLEAQFPGAFLVPDTVTIVR